MSLLLFKILAALLILLTSLVVGIGALRKSHAQPEHHWLELGEALGGGIFLGIAFFHIGVLIGSILAHGLQSRTGLVTAAVFNALAAGTFMYIATLHKTNHLCRSKHTDHFVEFLLLLVGLGLMAVVEIWL